MSDVSRHGVPIVNSVHAETIELTGVALEIPARVTVSFEVKKGYTVNWPRIVSDDFVMVAGSARPWEAAARIAWVELIDWMVSDYGFDRMRAYHFLGQVGRMRRWSKNASPKRPWQPRMKTSRRALDRLLEPSNTGVTLHTMQKAAAALGRKIRLELI